MWLDTAMKTLQHLNTIIIMRMSNQFSYVYFVCFVKVLSLNLINNRIFAANYEYNPVNLGYTTWAEISHTPNCGNTNLNSKGLKQ